MVSVIECDTAEREHLDWLWRDPERRRERPWLLSRRRERWERRSGVPAIHIALILTERDKEPWVSWIAAAAVTKTWHDSLNCRIDVSGSYALITPIRWSALRDSLSTRAAKFVKTDGTLPRGAGQDVLDVLRRLAPDTEAEIARIGSLSDQIFIDTPELERKAFQRDGTITALKMAAFTPADETIPDGVPISQAPWALPNGRIIEDQQIVYDAGRFDGWDAQDAIHVSGTSFVDPVSGQRLSVYYANRTRVERATGADLIYYHETRRCFILVQYKKLAACNGEDRWRYYPRNDKSIDTELRRLQAVDDTCADLARPGDDYRLAGQPTWFKFCQEQSVLPSGTDLVPGMYLPRPYLAALLAGEELTGDRDGQVVSYRTVPRYMDNTTFTSLVAGGWIGTSALGTADVHERIRDSLARGDDVIYAHGEGHPLKRAEHVATQRKSSAAKRRG